MRPAAEVTAVEELVACAAGLTGFSREAILTEAVRRAASSLGGRGGVAGVLARARAGDPEVERALCQAVSVGETYFFRQPDHFVWLAHEFVPERKRAGATRLRAWSAGCATGEEAWSLAACLTDCGVAAEVIGTDLLARNLEAGRTGVYGAWSRRETAPILHPLFEPAREQPPLRVLERLRKLVEFREHNLLAPPPGDGFDVILCRNVLVYFAPEAARAAVQNLVAALAPGGALLLGTMDLQEPPTGLVAAGSSGAQIWRRPAARREAPARPGARRERQAEASGPRHAPPATPEPVALHLRALQLVEHGHSEEAARALDDLVRLAPDYLPGLLERALLAGRRGARGAAAGLMRDVLRRAEALPPDAVLAAPEPLPARFFRETAEAWLRGGGR